MSRQRPSFLLPCLGYHQKLWPRVKVDISNSKMQTRRGSFHLNDLIKTSVDASRLEIGTKIYVTKMGYNEELDRTKWRIDQIVSVGK